MNYQINRSIIKDVNRNFYWLVVFVLMAIGVFLLLWVLRLPNVTFTGLQ